jgi:thymidylate kinase
LIALEPERWVVVDADRPFAEVQQELKTILLQQLQK